MGGANRYRGETYIDIVGEELGLPVRNRAITMSTTREGRIIFNEEREADLVIVAFGLVDSWRTFKYAPYVLYYPDTLWRRIGRKIVKKYKKSARSLGLNRLLGEKFVVPPEEYRENLASIAERGIRTIFIETPPHRRERFRNPDIARYNKIMEEVAQRYRNADLVKLFDSIQPHHYLDAIHLNQEGYRFVAQKILELL